MYFLYIYRCLNTDVLELYETNEQGNEVVHRFCGKVFPSPIMARREIRIRFKSMKESSHQGFKARFEFLTNAQLNTGKWQQNYKRTKIELVFSISYKLACVNNEDSNQSAHQRKFSVFHLEKV